jgi:hypothetical protein
MKKLVFGVLFLVCSLNAFTQEKKAAVGLGLEWNMNSPRDPGGWFAGGVNLNFDYNLPSYFAVGFTVTGSNNFYGFKTLEATALLRNYVQRNDYSGFFLQIDIGTFIEFEDGDVTPMIEIGARAGFRIPLGSYFYVEPYGRASYPGAFGLGAMVGINF